MIAIDTNVLVHAHQREASLHEAARRVVRELAESPAAWSICHHSLIEFYAVVTHPRLWKAPSAPAQAIDQIAAWRESPSLRILFDNTATLDQWSSLTLAATVKGGHVHDARIAACCLAHGVRELWTVDRDFGRYPSLKTRNPLIKSR